MTKQERELILREKLIVMQKYEKNLREQGIKFIGGVDEVGRGPLAGPVVTACVILPENFHVLGVDDSKKLSEKKREALYEIILEKAVGWGLGFCDNKVIDKINILEATKKAMKEAVENANNSLLQKGEGNLEHLLIDAVKLDNLSIPQTSIIKGDANSISIAAASIIAKVTRDRLMVEYSEKYPHYGFESNKGYGTKAHYEGIQKYGITPIHRETFLKNIL